MRGVSRDAPTRLSSSQVSKNQALTPTDPSCASTGASKKSKIDPELAALAEAWPTLPVSVKAEIRALVDAARQSDNERTNPDESSA